MYYNNFELGNVFKANVIGFTTLPPAVSYVLRRHTPRRVV